LPVAAAFHSSAARVESFFTVIVPNNVEGSIELVYQGLFGPCLTVLFVLLALVFIRFIFDQTALTEERLAVRKDEVIVAAGLLLAPIIGAAVALVERGVFYARYVHWAVAGFAILLGFGAGILRSRNYLGVAMPVFLAFVLARDFLTPLHKRLEGEVQTSYGPEDSIVSYVRAGDPMALHELLDEPLPDLPVITPSLKDFLYIEYNSEALRSGLHYAYPQAPDFGAYFIDGLRDYYHAPYTEPITDSELLQEYPQFLFYATVDGHTPDLLRLLRGGAAVTSFKLSGDGTHFIARISSPQNR
jgi:hypothetical protein